ncbi:MAG: clostripain-related cysteine peptidase [Candidatus Babeliales bacterium]|jgi:hypothetical protein
MLKKCFFASGISISLVFATHAALVPDKLQVTNYEKYNVINLGTSSYTALELNDNLPLKDHSTPTVVVGINTNPTLELAYQIGEKADFLIASQQPIVKDPRSENKVLDSTQFMKKLDNPIEFSCRFIQNYAEYLRKPKEDVVYTLSAIDLSKIPAVITNITSLIDAVNSSEAAGVKKAVAAAANNATAFDDYIDLGSFYTQLSKQIKDKKIADIITEGLRRIQKAVVARVSPQSLHACGLSVYYPKDAVQDSYKSTDFETQTGWLKFITQS